MRRRFTIEFDRPAWAAISAAALLLAALSGALATEPAGASVPHVATPLYAYAGGSATSPVSCPADATHNPAIECSLAEALTIVAGHAATN
ncbi:MAG TPA: hypothetical protein VF320_03625 [Acidimicrobiales bacterium]